MAWKAEPCGNLRKRVTIEAPVGNRDPRGAREPTYSSVGIFWAKVRPISASEFLRNIGGAPLQTWAERAVEFTIRYRNGLGLTQRHRIRMGQRIFNIVGFVNRDELNVNLVITTAEVLA